MASFQAPLDKATGYGIIIGLGFAFALGMMLTTFVLRRYNNELQTSEVFSTAGRTVKSGLVASAVVSSWTWAATLLQSSSVAFRYGVSGPFWYASGATVQIILFATLAIELKRKAPNAHTFMEVVRARYGAITHLVYIVFGLMTNILVSAQLLAGGSAVVQALTGVPTAAACFILPIGVVLYTMFGGIKATFLTDYFHTCVLIIIILVFAFTAYATGSELGSPSVVYDRLVAAGKQHPVPGNKDGSYLSFKSTQGAIFFVINIVGNFGTVFLDNGYWNKAVSAHPVHALPGYVAGGLSWFAVPWLTATTMGLAALALQNSPSFPTYPNPLPDADITAGLVLPSAAVAMLGKGGAVASLLLVFMAVTSAMSAELIAVSSIFTYDVYQTYVNPEAKGRRLIYISHLTCVVYAIVIAGFATGLYYAGISLGYLYLMMGVIISGAVLPASLTLLWSRQSWAAATFTPPLALACSLTAWLVTAKSLYGNTSVASTGSNYPMLAGNVVALLSPLIFVPVLTLVFRSPKYDWLSMRSIRKADDHDMAANARMDLELIPGEAETSAQQEEEEQRRLTRSAKIARSLTVFLTVSLLVLWPMPLLGSEYIFSKGFFTGWVAIAILWLFCSGFCVGVYPIWEGRHTSSRMVKYIFMDVFGKGAPVLHGRASHVEESSEGDEKGDVKGVHYQHEKTIEG